MGKQETKLCKHCKTEIPKGAKICPNCRKKQGGKLKWIIIAIIAIGVIGAAAGGGDSDSEKKAKSNTNSASDSSEKANEEQAPIEYTPVTATELSDALESNAMKAQNDYKDKYISISGTLGNIDSNGKYIAINSDKDFDLTNIQCYLKDDAQKQAIMEMSQGDAITVKGYCKEVGELMGYQIDIDEIIK